MGVVPLPASTRRSNRHRRLPEIIDAAARVFAERGFHGATTQDIANVLGIRQASLYYYFASKEAALELVCLRGVEGFVERAKTIAAGPQCAAKRLEDLVFAHHAPLSDRPDYVRVFLNERQHLPAESRRRIGRLSRELEQIFQKVVSEGIDKGEFDANLNPRVTVLAILGMCNAVASWQHKENLPISQIAAQFARMALQGVKARGD